MEFVVNGITKSFGEKQVLKGISFSVESGKAMGLLGRNGAGKTTTIRILMDVFHANSGTITLDGQPFDARKTQIGYLPEERGLYPKKTVMQQLVYLARLRGVSKKYAVAGAEKWLARLGVDQYKNALLETLSKGNQQKVQLASTLVCDPQLVILDEPFSGLDPVNSQVLKDVIRELIEAGKLVIFSSHQMSYVEEFCDDIVIINDGEVVMEGDLLEIKREAGKNQYVFGDAKLTPAELAEIIEKQLEGIVTVEKVRKQDVVVKMCEGVDSNAVITKLLGINGVTLERMYPYEPSLNDIFVEKVGE